jgi:hypothetical protein
LRLVIDLGPGEEMQVETMVCGQAAGYEKVKKKDYTGGFCDHNYLNLLHNPLLIYYRCYFDAAKIKSDNCNVKWQLTKNTFSIKVCISL